MICESEKNALTLYEETSSLSKNVLYYPSFGVPPYLSLSPKTQRLSTLYALLENNEKIVITSVNAFICKTPPLDFFLQNHMSLETKKSYSRLALLQTLESFGYKASGSVYEKGEFCIKGSLIDIFPLSEKTPVRIDFFDTTIETIKPFDPLSQKSTSQIDAVNIHPILEIVLNEKTLKTFEIKYPGRASDKLYQNTLSKIYTPGLENYLSCFYDTLETLMDFLPRNTPVFYEHTVPYALDKIQKEIQHKYSAKKEEGSYFPDPKEMYLDAIKAEFIPTKDARALNSFSPFRHDTQKLIHACYNQFRKKTLLTYQTPEIKKKLQDFFPQAQEIDQWEGDLKDGIYLLKTALSSGFLTPDFSVITQNDLFGIKQQKKNQNKRVFTNLKTFHTSDLVIHEKHGLGQFEKFETLMISGFLHECLKLLYHGGDKLFLPVENINVLSKYGSKNEGIQLDKLGSKAWQIRKAKTEEKILKIAQGLLEIAAKRQLKTAPKINLPESYIDFCARFPYQETPDQFGAIDEICTQLEKGSLMDRLICGDVGFGKTEIAMRAAFIMAKNGYQVALLCPTTMLCHQHEKSFNTRFEESGINIKSLSRFTPPSYKKQIKEEIERGGVDIVIATHTLLSQNLSFKNLGMIIIDEEQKFGVKQKEALKELKENVHVLTMSATPIPRTLQMSLTGVKELSLITTPPINRRSVQTHVIHKDNLVIFEAIQHEIERGGKVLYVIPRISFIEEIEQELKEKFPTLSICVLHSKSKDVEGIIENFYNKKIDILIATHIIESGIDVPFVNTLIVDHANYFGLSQLYQIKGRVGRSDKQAYTYFILDNPTPTALKRMSVMQSLDHLGAGFDLASHDLEIRGAGNIVGAEQSGHIKNVGIELYQTLLEESIMRLQNQKIETQEDPIINLSVPIFIPDSYISDMDTKMNIYRRLGDLKKKSELDAFASELMDRFGNIPEDVYNLFDLVECKQLCLQGCVKKMDVSQKGLTISFNQHPRLEKIQEFMQALKALGTFKLRPDNSLAFLFSENDHRIRMRVIRIFFSKLFSFNVFE